MLCPNCESENVNIVDGQFFCSECQSQQLAAREETVQEEELNFTRRNIVGSSSGDESTRDAYSSSSETCAYSVYDGFNIILHKQVSALINLGASDKLKNVVLFIWAKYLKKCEALFSKENANDRKKTNGTKAKGNSGKKKSKTKKKSDTDDLNKDSDASENDSMEVEPFGAAPISDSENFWSHYASGSIDCIDRMTLSKTLCFCYLGLLYTQDRLLLTDLLRLAQEERIPFLNASQYLPSSIVRHSYTFNKHLFTHIRTSVPDVNWVSKTSSRLISFLGLPKVNNRSLIPIVLQFVKDLNLPDNIIHIVKMLIDKVDSRSAQCHRKGLPLYDVQAIAMIIIVFKIFYVLDGEYEFNHCDISRKINIILKDRRLFVWEQWQKQASLKEYLFLKPGSNCSKISLIDSLSSSQIVSKYGVCKNIPEAVKRNYYTTRKNMVKVFHSLRSGTKAIPETPAPTSFPLTQDLTAWIENWKNLPCYGETEELDFSLITEKFSSDLIFYQPSFNEDESSKEIIKLLCDSLYKSLPCMDGSDLNIIQTFSNYWCKTPKKYDSELTWLNDFAPSFQWLIKFMSKYINTSCDVVYREMHYLELLILPPAKLKKDGTAIHVD